MSFASDVQNFRAALSQRAIDLHARVADLAFTSIVDGSPLTGAPGQPVSSGSHAGRLKGSWTREDRGPLVTVISSDEVYAPYVEDGSHDGKDLVLHSPTGGFHSVALTRAGWDRIVDQATREIASEVAG